MTAKRLTFPATLTLVVAIALGVTSCSADATATSPPAVEPTAIPTTETPAEEPIVDPTIDPNLTKIGLSDGTWTTMEPGGPIPEEIVADVKARLNAGIAAIEALNLPSNGENAPADTRGTLALVENTATNLSKDLSAATGRTVFVVFQTWGGNDASFYSTAWVSSGGYSVAGLKQKPTKDAYLAALNAWIAAQPDPSAYEVIAP